MATVYFVFKQDSIDHNAILVDFKDAPQEQFEALLGSSGSFGEQLRQRFGSDPNAVQVISLRKFEMFDQRFREDLVSGWKAWAKADPHSLVDYFAPARSS